MAAATFTRIVDKIEPLTRHDRASLALVSGQSRVASGSAAWHFAVRLSNDAESGTGHLPYGVQHLAGPVQVNDAAQRTVDEAYAELPQRFQTWLRTYEQSDRLLAASDCFDGPRAFGCEEGCSSCGTTGWLKCRGCDGKGYLPCTPCMSRGRLECQRCKSLLLGKMLGLTGASGRETCPGCHGNKKTKEGTACQRCGGNGHIQCRSCDGAKTIVCSSCRGERKHRHSDCGGEGRLPCQRCDTTGYLHMLRRVACTVSDRFGVHVSDTNGEVTGELGRRDLASLRTVAHVIRGQTTTSQDSLERHYSFACAIGEIVVDVASQRLAIVGYGDAAEVVDYKGIVTHLLASDLSALRAAVASTPLRPFGLPGALLDATRLFLASEVNVDVDNAEYLRDGIIDLAYRDEVNTFLSSALRRIFAARIGLAALGTAFIPALLFLAGSALDWGAVLGGWMYAVYSLAAALAYALLERHHRTRVTADFEAKGNSGVRDLGRRTDALLGKHRVLLTTRLIVAAIAAVMLSTLAAVLP